MEGDLRFISFGWIILSLDAASFQSLRRSSGSAVRAGDLVVGPGSYDRGDVEGHDLRHPLDRAVAGALQRVRAGGPGALANGRRRNGLKPSLLAAEVLKVMRLRLAEPPPDGGMRSSCKVADFIAAHLGLQRILPQRVWKALKVLGWSLQRQRHTALDLGQSRGAGPASAIDQIFGPIPALPPSRIKTAASRACKVGWAAFRASALTASGWTAASSPARRPSSQPTKAPSHTSRMKRARL